MDSMVRVGSCQRASCNGHGGGNRGTGCPAATGRSSGQDHQHGSRHGRHKLLTRWREGDRDRYLTSPLGLAVDHAGDLYVIDGNRVRKISREGTIATVAGAGRAGYSGDGGPAKRSPAERPAEPGPLTATASCT